MKGFIVYIPPRDPAFLLVSQAPDDKTLKAYWSEHFVLLLVFLEGSSINHKFQQVSTAKTNSNKSERSFNKEALTSSTSLCFEFNQTRVKFHGRQLHKKSTCFDIRYSYHWIS